MIGPDRILGISAGTVEEAIAAETAGADYIGVGAVFGTSTKKNARNMTVDQLREICGAVSIPVVAIGGIDAKNLMELSGSGVDGVAVVSAIFAAEDPGRAATSGSALLKTDAVRTLVEELLPIAALVTPNIPEAQVLCGTTIETKDDMMAAEKQMGDRYHCAVLLKGGHRLNDANDLLYTNGKMVWFEGKRISNPNTHGTGCT